MLREMRDLVWPMLDNWDVADRALLHREENDDIKAIRSLGNFQSTAVVLEAAAAIAADEERRRQVADARASTYLLVAAALVPLLTYLETAIWDGKQGSAPQWLTLSILTVGILNLMGAGWWSFRTIRTATFFTLDSGDIVDLLAKSSDFEAGLIVKRLEISRRNRISVNEKISCMGMAHRFMLRTFCIFGTLVLVEALCGLWALFHGAGRTA